MYLFRRFLIACSVVAFLWISAYSQSLHPLVAEQGYADLILFNGKVVSMDDRSIVPNTPGNIYEAMAVKKDRIMALGPSQRIRRMASSSTRVIDLQGKTVIPGIIDTHSHIYRVQRFADELDIKLPFSLSIPEGDTVEATRVNIFNAIREASREVPPGEWIVAGMVPNPKNGATNAVYWARDPKKMAHREFLDGAT
ncbi:MAG: amidohydrolase family protein, partial [Candidatus Binatia bacterium]